VCLNKFIGGTEGTANFMIGMRCIDEQDKIISLSIAYVMIGLFAMIPSPILFGSIIDGACVLWGKTCSKKGNCWLYDEEQLRYTLNFSAAGFVLIGTALDVGTWYYAKNVKLFDDEIEDEKKKEETTL
jgi:Organic Anion Transporter Polypeptide (OATP) family